MEWAHQQAQKFQAGPSLPLAVLVAEAYLHGANDALVDETNRIVEEVRDAARPVPAAKEGLARAAAAVRDDPRFIQP